MDVGVKYILEELEMEMNRLVKLEEEKMKILERMGVIKDAYLDVILTATDEKGKKIYSNAEMRELELRKRLRDDDTYRRLRDKLELIKLEIMRVKNKIEILKMKYEVGLELMRVRKA